VIAARKPVDWLGHFLLTAGLLALAAGALSDLSAHYAGPLAEGQLQKSFLAAAGLVLGSLGIALLVVWLPQIFQPLLRGRASLGPAVWLIALIIALAPTYLFLFSKWSGVYTGPYLRSAAYFVSIGLMAWLAGGKSASHIQWRAFLFAAVLFGAVFSLADLLKYTVSYPFSLYWSEGNRMWDNSIVFGRHLYEYPAGQKIPVLSNWVRMSLWGLPHLLPNVSIAFVRMWNGLVFSIPYMIFGWVLFRRKQEKPGVWFALGLWTFLFLNQGPIYTPLVLAAILVALARGARFWLAFLLVGLAGYYAATGRYTWMFAPAMWAAVIALVETNPRCVRTALDRWKRAVGLGLGGLAGGYLLPELVKRVNAMRFGTEIRPSVASIEGASTVLQRQPLMWDRLWPNETYSLGIVIGLLLAAGPLAVLLIYAAASKRWRLDTWQKLALVGMLVAFLVVGIIVSVKIGGGSNLHNVDMFLIGLLFAGMLAWESGLREWILSPGRSRWPVAALTLMLVLYPAWNSMQLAKPLILPDSQRAAFTLRMVQRYVSDAVEKGEVLFLDQRQLLTFGYVQDVPLVPEYEKKLVMDHAMAEDEAYFNPFYRDLASHRFALIVSEPLRVEFQGGVYHFGNENDAWVRWVAHPMLCYYNPVFTMRSLGVQLLLPKEKSQPRGGGLCPGY
jgi:hypothetical protein